MNIEVDPTRSKLASAMLNSKIRPRAVVRYGVKIFFPSPPNYVTRSPGIMLVTNSQNHAVLQSLPSLKNQSSKIFRAINKKMYRLSNVAFFSDRPTSSRLTTLKEDKKQSGVSWNILLKNNPTGNKKKSSVGWGRVSKQNLYIEFKYSSVVVSRRFHVLCNQHASGSLVSSFYAQANLGHTNASDVNVLQKNIRRQRSIIRPWSSVFDGISANGGRKRIKK